MDLTFIPHSGLVSTERAFWVKNLLVNDQNMKPSEAMAGDDISLTNHDSSCYPQNCISRFTAHLKARDSSAELGSIAWQIADLPQISWENNDGFHGKITSGMGETSYFMGFMGQPNWFPVPMFHSTNPYQSIDSWISWILRPNNWYLQYRWRLQDFVLFVPVLLRFHIHLCVEPPV